MRGKRSPWILVILILTGAIIGGFIGEVLSKHQYFSWMSFGGANGYRSLFAFSLDPLIDARVLKVGLDCVVSINAGSILGMALAIFIYSRI